jgi:hypothetical protein
MKKEMNIKAANNVLYFDKEGTAYKQRVTITLSQKEIDEFNKNVDAIKCGDKVSSYGKLFLKQIEKGDNYTNLTTFRFFREFFGLEKISRIDLSKNTIVRIIQTNKRKEKIMQKYKVCLNVEVLKKVWVEANSEKEAEEKAEEMYYNSEIDLNNADETIEIYAEVM